MVMPHTNKTILHVKQPNNVDDDDVNKQTEQSVYRNK